LFLKLLNTIFLALQWGFSLLAAIYLLVPGYTFEKTPYSGNNYYNPYLNWNDNPLTEIIAEENSLIESTKNDPLYLSVLDFAAPVYVLDTLLKQHIGRFFLGYSMHDVQYLVMNYRKNHKNSTLVLKSTKLTSNSFTSVNGINLIQLSDSNDEAYWDTLLNNGQPVFAYADAVTGFSKNLVNASDLTSGGLLNALKNGKNLMVFSRGNLADKTRTKIPVIRKIEWHQSTIHIDLSQPANISLISSGFRLDTMAQSLHLKLIDQDWMRFKINFKNDSVTYISNPVFRFDGTSIEPHTLKPDNLRSIFYNLTWLIGIVLFNLIINKFRRTFIYARN